MCIGAFAIYVCCSMLGKVAFLAFAAWLLGAEGAYRIVGTAAILVNLFVDLVHHPHYFIYFRIHSFNVEAALIKPLQSA